MKTKSFIEIIQEIIAKNTDWTETDCQNWREENDWYVKQAKRIRLFQFSQIDPKIPTNVFASILDTLDQWNGDLLLNRYLNESYKLSAEQRFCISALLAMSDD